MESKSRHGKVRDALYSVVAGILALSMLAANVEAQSTRSGSGDARMQQALQQLTNEKAQLQAENARLKKDAEEAVELRKTNEKLTRELEYAQKRLGRTETNNEALGSSLEATRARLDEIIAQYREMAMDYRETEQNLAAAGQSFARSTTLLETCVENNDEIAVIATDALDRYENKGFFTKTKKSEPFTGITRARIENLVEEYRYDIEDLRLPQEVIDQLEILKGQQGFGLMARPAPAAGSPEPSAEEQAAPE